MSPHTRITTAIPFVAAALALAIQVPAASAQSNKVYRKVLPDGTVEYTDVPADGATRQKLPGLSTYTPTPTPSLGNTRRRRSGGDNDSIGAVQYEVVSIASPRNDAGVRANDGNVNVLVRLQPPLLAGHSLSVLLDGSPAAGGSTTSFLLSGVARGTHSLSVSVLDAAGQPIAQSAPVTFHVLRTTVRN